MNFKPFRRWFRFSLLSMFIVITAICCWLGYSVNWIRQREEFRKTYPFCYPRSNADPFASIISAPGFLWLFGEDGYSDLFVPGVRCDEARRLFPEAEVHPDT